MLTGLLSEPVLLNVGALGLGTQMSVDGRKIVDTVRERRWSWSWAPRG
ncbi:hypothetical protein IU418_06515 [Nocardia farcinica]|nr:hypothetical protein [Nocardia farcinica]MBF6536858.1 hypothetical protein [Nocardia farcinica]